MVRRPSLLRTSNSSKLARAAGSAIPTSELGDEKKRVVSALSVDKPKASAEGRHRQLRSSSITGAFLCEGIMAKPSAAAQSRGRYDGGRIQLGTQPRRASGPAAWLSLTRDVTHSCPEVHTLSRLRGNPCMYELMYISRSHTGTWPLTVRVKYRTERMVS